jgi:hypothetical protein
MHDWYTWFIKEIQMQKERKNEQFKCDWLKKFKWKKKGKRNNLCVIDGQDW